MAESPPTDSYAQVVGDAQRTTSLIKDIDDVIGKPLRSFLQSRESQRKYLSDLGEWAACARNTAGQWLRPILTADKFKRHLEARDCCLTPTGVCSSRYGWAQLLFALAIRPDSGTVEWVLPHASNEVYPSEGLTLDMDGEVLCHILNVYRCYCIEEEPFDDKTRDSFYGITPFGRIAVSCETSGPLRKVIFEPRPMSELCKKRIPFAHGSVNGFERDAAVEPILTGTVFPTYMYLTLEIGISDTTLVLPSFDAPLQDRATCLMAALKELSGQGTVPRTATTLITSDWLEQASRILRRFTTDSGKDTTLPLEMILALEQGAIEAGMLSEYIDAVGSSIERMQGLLKSNCMLPPDSISCNAPRKEDSQEKEDMKAWEYLHHHFDIILAKFASSPENALKSTFARIPDVTKYFWLREAGHDFNNACVLVLWFTGRSVLWRSRCRVD